MDSLRPQRWSDFIGQEALKGRLQKHIQAAIARGDLLGHLLLVGPPGTGKTSLARLVAKELKADFISQIMPVKIKVIQKQLMTFEGVMFLDEIHRMPKKDQEWLLPVLEDGYMQGEAGLRYPLFGQLCVIGATTEPEKIIKPLYDRFLIRPSFEDYTDQEMARIIQRMASKLHIHPSDEEAMVLGRASAGIPRQAKQVVHAARDAGTTDPKIVLALCHITEDGLTEHHLDYLQAIESLGNTAGIDLLSNFLRLPKEIIVDTERLLVKRGYVTYSAKGRVMMGSALDVLAKAGRIEARKPNSKQILDILSAKEAFSNDNP